MRIIHLLGLAVIIFTTSFGVTYLVRDPAVDMSNYQDVVPEYKEQIHELMVVTNILRNPMYKLRHGKALNRLEALAEEGTVSEALDTAFIYYAQPEVFYCMDQKAGCLKDGQVFNESQTQKAFYWARKMEGDKKTAALSRLLRDARHAPVATEEDRIALMFATEAKSRVALGAAVALAFHHLDNRYFGNDMMDEALLWLNRARDLEQTL